MPRTEAEQKRIDKLQRAFGAVSYEHDRARRWSDTSKAEALGTAMVLLDAAIIAEEGEDEDCGTSDRRLMERLREIARDRDLLAPFRETPAAAEGEGAVA